MQQYMLDAAALVIACVVVMMSAVLLSLLPKLVPKPQPSSGARRRGTAAPRGVKQYIPFSTDLAGDDVLVVDCTHPTAPTLTHHKNSRNPPLSAVPGADTSTGLALNALRTAAASPDSGSALSKWLDTPYATVNHFDGDAVLSAWSVINPEQASRHEAVLRHASRIGDFREAALGTGQLAMVARGWDGLTSEEQVRTALKLACWINSIELSRFSAPYEDKDADEKFAFFLDNLLPALEDPEALRGEWEEEYQEVLEGWRLLAEGREGAAVVRHEGVGLAVLRSPRPLHYYALFSHAIGCDVVATLYPGNRYEVESRYTQFVNLFSRPVTARLDLGQLAAALNEIDTGREAGTEWVAPRFVDTGPLLRLDRGGEKLSKAERYGHPTARPMFASGLPPERFQSLVLSYFEHGLRGLRPKVGGWSWEELNDINSSIDWEPWRRSLTAEAAVH